MIITIIQNILLWSYACMELWNYDIIKIKLNFERVDKMERKTRKTTILMDIETLKKLDTYLINNTESMSRSGYIERLIIKDLKKKGVKL